MIFRQRQGSSFGFELPPQPNPPFICQRSWSPLEYCHSCCFPCMIATLDKGIFVALSDVWFLLDTNQFNHNFLHKFLIFTSQGIHGEHQSSVEFAMKLPAGYLFWFILIPGRNIAVTKFGNIAYRSPRVFGDKFGEKFGEKIGDSLNSSPKLSPHFSPSLVNH